MNNADDPPHGSIRPLDRGPSSAEVEKAMGDAAIEGTHDPRLLPARDAFAGL
jgi:hypothetical protein